MSEGAIFKTYLERELERRCGKNPHYSLRSFARSIGIDVSVLSRILAGHKLPSATASDKILKALDLNADENDLFTSSVAQAHRERTSKRLNPKFKESTVSAADIEQAKIIEADVFRTIADWHHISILELTSVEGFKAQPRWIAAQLGIRPIEAKLAVERLVRAGLLVEKGETLVRTEAQLSTGDKSKTDAALKRRQRQILEKAIESLENDPIESRDTSSMSMAIDPDRIPEAKRRIQTFKRELCAFLEGGNRRRVYELSLSLFPVQKS